MGVRHLVLGAALGTVLLGVLPATAGSEGPADAWSGGDRDREISSSASLGPAGTDFRGIMTPEQNTGSSAAREHGQAFEPLNLRHVFDFYPLDGRPFDVWGFDGRGLGVWGFYGRGFDGHSFDARRFGDRGFDGRGFGVPGRQARHLRVALQLRKLVRVFAQKSACHPRGEPPHGHVGYTWAGYFPGFNFDNEDDRGRHDGRDHEHHGDHDHGHHGDHDHGPPSCPSPH